MASCPGLRSLGRTHPRWKVECAVPQWCHPLGSHGELEFRAVMFFFLLQVPSRVPVFFDWFYDALRPPKTSKRTVFCGPGWIFFSFNVFGRPSKIWGRYLLNRDGNGQQHSQPGRGMAEIGAAGNQWTGSKTSKTQKKIVDSTLHCSDCSGPVLWLATEMARYYVRIAGEAFVFPFSAQYGSSRKSPYSIQNSSLASSYTLRKHSDNHQTSASKHQNYTIQTLQV